MAAFGDHRGAGVGGPCVLHQTQRKPAINNRQRLRSQRGDPGDVRRRARDRRDRADFDHRFHIERA